MIKKWQEIYRSFFEQIYSQWWNLKLHFFRLNTLIAKLGKTSYCKLIMEKFIRNLREKKIQYVGRSWAHDKLPRYTNNDDVSAHYE